jgi:hypothetical protein
MIYMLTFCVTSSSNKIKAIIRTSVFLLSQNMSSFIQYCIENGKLGFLLHQNQLYPPPWGRVYLIIF